MEILRTLFATDLQQALRKYQSNRLSSTVVLIGFLATFSVFSWIIFFFTCVFFRNLLSYEIYGSVFIHYIFHASILTLLWLGSISSALSQYAMYSRDNSLALLRASSVKPFLINWWVLLRSFILTVILLGIFFIPILTGYAEATLSHTPALYVSGIMTLILLAFVTTVIGNFLTLFSAYFLKRNGVVFMSLLLGVLALSGIWLFRVIFHEDLRLLNTVAEDNFFSIYPTLPLANSSLVTTWIVDGLLSSNLFFLSGMLLCTFFFGWAVIKSMTGLLSQSQEILAMSSGVQQKRSPDMKIATTSLPVTYKDLLSIVRTRSEYLYGIFISALGGVFFYSLWLAQRHRPMDLSENIPYILFVFLTFLFFATAYFLRLIFPLMAKEGGTQWLLRDSVIEQRSIINQKIIAGLILSLPLLLGADAVWHLFPTVMHMSVTVITILTTLLLALFHVIFGSIRPAFHTAQNPEASSNTPQGILTLLISILISAFAGYVLYITLRSGGGVPLILTSYGTFLAVITLLIHKLHTLHYEE